MTHVNLCFIRRLPRRRKNKGATTGIERGFTLIELVVVVIIVALLITVAIARLLSLAADAERVAMETTLGTLRSALGMKFAEHVVRQDMNGLQALAGSNPMDRLAELPVNYLGAFDRADAATIEDGHWYFDRAARQLVYRVRNRANFTGGVANPPRARFGIELVYADRNANGRFDAGVDAIEGLRLAAVEAYAWMR